MTSGETNIDNMLDDQPPLLKAPIDINKQGTDYLNKDFDVIKKKLNR